MVLRRRAIPTLPSGRGAVSKPVAETGVCGLLENVDGEVAAPGFAKRPEEPFDAEDAACEKTSGVLDGLGEFPPRRVARFRRGKPRRERCGLRALRAAGPCAVVFREGRTRRFPRLPGKFREVPCVVVAA